MTEHKPQLPDVPRLALPIPEPDDDGVGVVGCGDECCCSRLRDDVYR